MSTPTATPTVDLATFGPLLRAVLVSGGVVAAVYVAVLFSGLLPPRSPWLGHLATALVAIGIVELGAVTMASIRLIRSADSRSARNLQPVWG